MICPRCETENLDSATVCASCGHDLGAATIICASCGNPNPANHRFCGHCGAALRSRNGDLSQDRRQVTVVFADMVGSTGISRSLDPEDLDELLRAVQQTCDDTVAGFGGYPAQFLGDGILAYFGYPTAREDDVERAVLAGLSIVESMRRLDGRYGQSVAMRVGIATGRVLAGHRLAQSNPMTPSPSVVGDTPNLAARLQALARPNEAVASSLTREIVRNLFDFEDLGSHTLKGFSAPVRAWGIRGVRANVTRFEAIRSGARVPLVGRREELALLRSKWELAARGHGQSVLIAGEAGIGKSRLVEDFRHGAPANAVTLMFQCSPHFANTAFHPVIAQIESRIGLAPGDDETTRREKLRQEIAAVLPEPDHAVELLARLLSIRGDREDAGAESAAHRVRDDIFRALLAYLDALSREQPLLVIVEDAHWIDPSTFEFIGMALDWVRSARALFTITTRSEFSSVWSNFRELTTLNLDRLAPSQSAEMARALTAALNLPENIVEQLCDRSDGMPLFIEELAASLLQSGKQDETDAQPKPETDFAIPATLRDSLMARLDMLGRCKHAAQIGAVIGREFDIELLTAITEHGIAELQQCLENMERAALVQRKGIPPKATYSFRHSLVLDAAYESLLRSQRQKLHGKVAEILESRFEHTEPELLAHHYTMARAHGKAIDYWEAAGKRALQSSADREAVGHFDRATQLLAELPISVETKRRELSLRIRFGPPMINTLGPLSNEVQANYRRTSQICRELPDSHDHFAAIWGAWRITRNFPKKREIADQLLRLADRLDDDGLRLQAHHTQWASLFHLGLHEDCIRHVEAGLRLYEQRDYSGHASIYGGHDPKVCGCGEAAFSLWLMGRPEEAVASSRAAMSWARSLAHAGSIAHALDMSLLFLFISGDVAGAAERADELSAFAAEEGFPIHKAKALIYRGWAIVCSGEVEEGLKAMGEGFAQQTDSGTREDFPVFYNMLADALRQLKAFDEAIGLVDQAFSEADENGLQYWIAELYRYKGELLFEGSGAVEEAEENLRKARAVAAEQGATVLEARATESLARLLTVTGRSEEARGLADTTRDKSDPQSANAG